MKSQDYTKIMQIKLFDMVNDAIEQIKSNQDMNNSLKVECCLTCHRVLEIYRLRSQAITFNSDNIVQKLNSIKVRLIDDWTEEDNKFILQIYKNSKSEDQIQYEINEIHLGKKDRIFQSEKKIAKQRFNSVHKCREISALTPT